MCTNLRFNKCDPELACVSGRNINSAKRGESISVQVCMEDDTGTPYIIPVYSDICVIIRSTRTIAFVFKIGDTGAPARTDIDADGYIAFVLSGEMTMSMSPGEYYMEISVSRGGGVVRSITRYIFTLI